MCRMDMCDSDMQVAGGRHVITPVHATADILTFWELLSGLRLDWEWHIRFFVLREPAEMRVALEPKLQDYIELGAAPEQHAILGRGFRAGSSSSCL